MNNNLNDLLCGSVSAVEWCEEIIKTQKKEIYHSLTNPKDLNHIVKAEVCNIHGYFKKHGITSLADLPATKVNLRVKTALNILYNFLKSSTTWKASLEKPLTDEQLNDAFNELYINQVVDSSSYIKCDRKFNDPQICGQNYALYSFNPSKGVIPDSDGIYGFIKIRGIFNRLEEADEKSKELIQYFSANQIFICKVGQPVPLQNEIKNKDNIIEIDHPDREEKTAKFAELIGDQTLKEKKQIEEIKQREKLLKADVTKNPNDKDPLQKYIELNHKRATLAYMYNRYKTELEDSKNKIIISRAQIADMDAKYPNLKHEYMDHYRKASEECGIDKATDDMAVMIKTYIAEDPDLGF